MPRIKESVGHAKSFKVTITETLKMTVEVEAGNPHEAEQAVYEG